MTTLGAVLTGLRRPARPARGAVLPAIAAAIVVVLALVALLAPFFGQPPLHPDLGLISQPPSLEHPLGTDSNGRDILLRLVFGARTALAGPLLVAVLTTVVGAGLALFATWRGGVVDSVISRVFDLLFAFPGLLLAILATAVFGKGLTAAAIALSISYIPYVGRIVRGAALREVSLPYVRALRAAGFGGLGIATRHFLPNFRPLLLSQAAIMFSYAMIDLAAISFLGLGVQPPEPDWGSMVGSGLPGILAGAPEEAISACVVLVLTIASVNLLGERLGDAWGGGRR